MEPQDKIFSHFPIQPQLKFSSEKGINVIVYSPTETVPERKITGQDFLDMSKEDFMQAGLEMGPAMRLAKEVQTLKEKPKRSFLTYRSLKEVLAKYNIGGNGNHSSVSTNAVSLGPAYSSQFYRLPINLKTTKKN
ncbi:hypothetical protein C1645_742221 [Glomus cerebriforme]|uniref:SAM domain-containing protein n=1 Tax=Glomus cerebriforme TaxID=658196 RepID=A0A397SEB6_9GLOM|nr:hypothetical protein C1645_742221 [Glomus cerebriforme]